MASCCLGVVDQVCCGRDLTIGLHCFDSLAFFQLSPDIRTFVHDIIAADKVMDDKEVSVCRSAHTIFSN